MQENALILTIDIGNTNIVIGAVREEEILFEERISTDCAKTALEYRVFIKEVLELAGIRAKEITGAIIASSVPPIVAVMAEAIHGLFGMKPLVVGPGVKNGLSIRMDNPAQVGADLIVDAVAGLQYYGAPLVLVDMGTATTISVIDRNRNYVGGMIMPGVQVSLDALVDSAAQLPRISLEEPKKIIGKNTIDSMKSGVVLGQAASIDGAIERIWAELGETETAVVATGGLSGLVVPFCNHAITVDSSLTIKGLALIYRKNQI